MNFNQKIITRILGATVLVGVLGAAGWHGWNIYTTRQERVRWEELAAKHDRGPELLHEIDRRQGELRDDKPENDSLAYAYIAASIASMGDKAGAHKYYEKAILLDQMNHIALNNKAQLFEDEMNWRKAEEYYLKLIAANPGFVPAYRSLANLYRFRFENAEKKIKSTIDRGLIANNNHTDLLSWIIAYYQETDQHQKAVPYATLMAQQFNNQGQTPGIKIK